MKHRHLILAIAAILLMLAAFVGAQEKSGTAGNQTSGSQATQPVKVRKGYSPDQAYKSNCTRCHAEVPKVDEKRSKTILRHMRVRGNLTKDEAEAILQYMTQ